jgi:hypothetical protein
MGKGNPNHGKGGLFAGANAANPNDSGQGQTKTKDNGAGGKPGTHQGHADKVKGKAVKGKPTSGPKTIHVGD